MTLSIILLDDEPAVLDIFREAYGGRFDVRTAETLSAARRLLAEGRPDVVISDQVMPEISGTEFLQEVADRHPSCYRVILTGSLTVWAAAAEISSGLIHFFLPKP